jgi:hypothetical protein
MMNRLKNLTVLALLFTTTACTSMGAKAPAASQPGLDTQLKVTSGLGHLKAKLVLKNMSAKEMTVGDLNSKNFKVETADGKAMPFKGASAPGESLHLKPGESTEAAFNLQDNYPFWDRRTKYKIWYEAPDLKSNVVQVWF